MQLPERRPSLALARRARVRHRPNTSTLYGILQHQTRNQCDDWRLTVQEDHGNLGLKMPVDMLILPENEEPTRLRITDTRQSSVDWTVNYARGTRFAIASFDAGSSGTGGVGGDIYT